MKFKPNCWAMRQHLAAAVAFAGWYLFAFTGPYSTTAADLGLVLALVGSLLVAPQVWRDLRSEPIFWAVLALLVYLTIHMAIFVPKHPEQAAGHNPHWSYWFRVGGLWALLLGWWLYRYPRHVTPLMVVLVAGLLAGVLVEVRIAQLLDGEVWHRSTWGYQPNYLGMASGAAFLTVLAWLGLQPRGHRPLLEWGVAVLALAALLFLFLVSGSRQAWLVLPVGLVALILVGLSQGGENTDQRRRAIGALIGLVLVSASVLLAHEHLLQRLGSQWEVIRLVLSFDFQAAAEAGGSFGIRVSMWLSGLQALGMDPWFGWGSGAGARMLQTERFSELGGYGHFHNLYVEIAVSFGLVGLTLFAAVILLILRQSWRAMRVGAVSPAMAAGLVAVTAFLLVILAFSIRIGQTEGRALLTVLMAFHAYAMFRLAAGVAR